MSAPQHVIQISTVFVPAIDEPYAQSSVIVHAVTKCGRIFRRTEYGNGTADRWECLPNVAEGDHV